MIEPHIEIVLDDDHRWLLQWRSMAGPTHRRTFGARKTLLDAMPLILAEVRGIPFPSIDMLPDETITIGTPQRRRTD